jgi:hypothetical protein
VHHTHCHEEFTNNEGDSLPYSSSVPPAWYRAEARTKQLSTANALAPFPKLMHAGEYEWVPLAEDHAAAQQQQQVSGLSGSETFAAGGSYRWSCCLHPLRDARGCQAVDVDARKKRRVLARSDDPHSAAAWGMGCASMSGGAGAVGIHSRTNNASIGGGNAFTSAAAAGVARSAGLDLTHVRARSGQAAAALSASLRSSPVVGGTAGVAARSSSSGMGLSGPGVAAVLRYEHTGRFETLKTSTDGEAMWSCCGAASADSVGCVAKTVTREARWQMESP